jgi:hypothetical protein
MYRVITIEREYGCGAAEIARKLASKLGWKLWDRDLTAEIARVALIRAGAVTHNFHMDQRYIGLEMLGTTPTGLTVKLPPNSNIAPPGAYMLFLLDGAAVPSAASIIKIA